MAGILGNKPEIVKEGQKIEHESFFCSELVAAALKALGLLPASIPCSQYWPVTFSQEKVIKFEKDAKLDLEMVINFDL